MFFRTCQILEGIHFCLFHCGYCSIWASVLSLTLYLSLSLALSVSLTPQHIQDVAPLIRGELFQIHQVCFVPCGISTFCKFSVQQNKNQQADTASFYGQVSSRLEAKFILKWLNIGKQFSSVLTSCLPLHNSMTSNGSQV